MDVVPARQPWQKPAHRHWQRRRATAPWRSRRRWLRMSARHRSEPGAARSPRLCRRQEHGRRPEAHLLCGRLDPLERAGGDWDAGLPRYRRRQHGRLVETPRPQPPPMQRHRDRRVGVGEDFTPGLADPAAHHWCKVKPIAIFERVHQRPRNFIKAHRGASAVIARRIGNRLHRQDAGSGVVDERRAESLAIRSRDEGQFRPAPAHRARPSTGSRQAGHSGGSARSSTRRNTE